MTMNDSPIRLLALAAIALLVGPVIGIVVDRAAGRVRFRPEHRCVNCQAPQGRVSLAPIRHWFQRCQTCSRNKGLRYPALDLALTIVFVALGLRFAHVAVLGTYLGLAAVLVALSIIDIETHLLPNNVVWPSITAGLFLVLVVSGELGDERAIYSALLGAALLGGGLGLLHLAYEPGMGRGDVKLALLLGLFVGWAATDLFETVRLILYVVLLAFGGAGLVGLGYNLVHRRRGEIPFGPALASAALAIVLVAPAFS